MMLRTALGAAVFGAALLATACGGADADTAPAAQAAASSTETAAAPAANVPATGTVIEVKMITDDKGNYFEPSEVEARPGDVVRFVLVSGVHNVSFPADKNAGKSGLPGVGDYLQLPGQTYDVPVNMAPGEYFFQCDPHAALGMVGTLKVAN